MAQTGAVSSTSLNGTGLSCDTSSAPLSRATIELPLFEGVLQTTKRLFTSGGQGPLLTERQRQRAYVAVAARQPDDLGIRAHEAVQSSRGGGKSWAHFGREKTGHLLERGTGTGLGGHHPLLERGHDCILGLGDVRCLKHLNLADRGDGRRRERRGAPRGLRRH